VGNSATHCDYAVHNAQKNQDRRRFEHYLIKNVLSDPQS